MKILHISTALSWRGGEQQLEYLVNGLEKLGQTSWVMCPEKSKFALNATINSQIITYKKHGAFEILVAKKLTNIINKYKIEIIHLHDAKAHTTLWLSHLIFGLRTPVVLSRKVDFPIKKISFTKYNSSIIKAYISVSHAVDLVLKNAVKDHANMHVIHDGIDLLKFKNLPKSNFLREKYSIDPHQILIANIAAITGHKDYFTFINTAVLLKKRYEERIRFLIIGADGGEQKEIEAYILRKNMQDSIHITGFIPDIYKHIGGIDVFLFTSKLEALGSSLLDVMASKVPIVSTYAGGIPEIVLHQKTGYLAQPGDALTLAQYVGLIIDNNNIRESIIEQAWNRVQHFSSELLAKKTLEIYQDVLQ